ncbi:MAG: hypothetical protein J0L92_26220 [Deltaproteobacteria bacterium]|nr:hypothetical protein [Deltaproteobacteria bacterium]
MSDAERTLLPLLHAFRAWAEGDGPGDGLASELLRVWSELAPRASSEDWALGAVEACIDLWHAWAHAETVPWRARVALIESGGHDWSATLRALASLSAFAELGHDGRETTWDALLHTAPSRDDMHRALARLTPLVDTHLHPSRLYGVAAVRLAALGSIDEALALSRRIDVPEARARCLAKLIVGLDPSRAIESLDDAWRDAITAPFDEPHYRLGGLDRLLAIHPSPHAWLRELEDFVETLSPEARACCPDHDDAHAILAEGWERAGDAARAAHWRARVPSPPIDEPVKDDHVPEADDDDPWALVDAAPSLAPEAIPSVLERALVLAVQPQPRLAGEWRHVLAALAAREDLSTELTTRLRDAALADWQLDDDLPTWVDEATLRAMLRRAIATRRRGAWRACRRGRARALYDPPFDPEQLRPFVPRGQLLATRAAVVGWRTALTETPRSPSDARWYGMLAAATLPPDEARPHWCALRGPDGTDALAPVGRNRAAIVTALGGSSAMEAWALVDALDAH